MDCVEKRELLALTPAELEEWMLSVGEPKYPFADTRALEKQALTSREPL